MPGCDRKFAHTNGAADRPPVLPQWSPDWQAFAAMVALRHAQATGEGQVVDLSVYEPLLWILGAQTSAYDQLGITSTCQQQHRLHVPGETFRARDGRYIALSGAPAATAMCLVRAAGRDDIHHALADWIAARDSDHMLATFAELGVSAGPV